MEKYEINIVYGEDKTKFNISKSSSIEKLKNFIEMYYEELKNERYEIIYNDINLKLIAKTETLQNVFAKENGMKEDNNKEDKKIIQLTINVESNNKMMNDTVKHYHVNCILNEKIKVFEINSDLTFQKFKFNILSSFPELEQENYQILYEDNDITNYYSNEKNLKDIFDSKGEIKIVLQTQPKIIIEYWKRCSFCHDRKADNICRKCALANCEQCSGKDTHNATREINYIKISIFKSFEQKILQEFLDLIKRIKNENDKYNSDNFDKMKNEKIALLNSKFDEIINLVNKIKKEQIDNLLSLLDEIEKKFIPPSLSAKIKDLYDQILAYKTTPFYDCEESMRKILYFERLLKFFVDDFNQYKQLLEDFFEKYRKCLNIDKKIIDFLSASLIETQLVFKQTININKYNKVMKVYDSSSVLVFDLNDEHFSIMNFLDDELKFKDNFNNFIQCNVSFNNQQKLFIVTGTPCQKFFVYDYQSNEMQFISTLKYCHNWWPSLVPLKRKVKGVDKEEEIVLFCLCGSYTNKCEMIVFNENTKSLNEEIKEEEKKEIPVIESEIINRDSLEMPNKKENEDPLSKTIKPQSENVSERIMQWTEISQAKAFHGQGSAFVYNNTYIYLLFGYDFALTPITLIERINIESLDNLVSLSVQWEDLQFKNPNNISSILYYNALLKENDDKIYVLGGLVEVDEIDFVYEYNVKDNALIKCDKKIMFNSVKFVNEKNFMMINKKNDYKEKEYAIVDGKNNVHIVSEGTFEYKTFSYNP